MEQDFLNSIKFFLRPIIEEAVVSAVNRSLMVLKEQEQRTGFENVQCKNDELLSAKEVCARLHISAPTLWRLQKQGKINPLTDSGQKRFYRYSDIEKYLG